MGARDAQYAEEGAWLREQRQGLGVSAKELAELLDISPQLVSQWENGQRPVSPDKANRIASVLRVKAADVWRNLGLTLPADPELPPLQQFLEWTFKRRRFSDPQAFMEKTGMTPVVVYGVVAGRGELDWYTEVEQHLGLPPGVLVAIRDRDAEAVRASGLSGEDLAFVLPLLPPEPPPERAQRRSA